MCEKCKIVRRRGVVFVVCADPRHKQRQGWRSEATVVRPRLRPSAGLQARGRTTWCGTAGRTTSSGSPTP